MAKTLFMHVGVAKTGTTYLQRILWANRDVLRAAGLLYPGKKSGNQFVASIDLRDLQSEKFAHLDVEGMWDKIAADVRAYGGNAVISHETFARCSSGEVRRVQSSVAGADLQVVITARDLGRQIPAVWQETLKNRATSSYSDYLTDIFLNPDSGEYKYFWRPQDVAKVVRRWGRAIGIENITVVTVPPPQAPRDELWRRFAQAIDLPAVDIVPPDAAGNVSLGPAEAELLRHINEVLPADFPWPRYSRQVKRQFVEQRLAAREAGRIPVPSHWHAAIGERASAMVEYLEKCGCRIIGDLDELAPVLPETAASGPDDVSREDILTMAAEVIRDEVIMRPPRRAANAPTLASDGWSARLHTAKEWLRVARRALGPAVARMRQRTHGA